MAFASTYFSRFHSMNQFIQVPPDYALNIIVVIPCFYEPDIITTLQSLQLCDKPKANIEIIVVVNHSEAVTEEIKQYNLVTYKSLEEYSKTYSSQQFRIFPILAQDLPKKHAGVGLARKIGMDEAVRRFDAIENSQGIIVCCDADSLVDSNYFIEIENYFKNNSKCTAANIHFEHPLQGNLPQNQYVAIAQYELHLRYYVASLTNINFPYAFHTVGSSCALRAAAYCRQGGMNKRQAGEDFYFLQKLFQSENFGCITTTKVIPSARVSQRVPFGTGYAMHILMETQTPIYYTYHPASFTVLQDFFIKAPYLYNSKIITIYESLHKSIQSYVTLQDFEKRIIEIQRNSKNEEMFVKRFYSWFNGFQVFKYLNFAHQSYFKKIPVQEAANQCIGISEENICNVLYEFRKIQS